MLLSARNLLAKEYLVIKLEPQQAAAHLNVPTGEQKLSEATYVLLRLLLTMNMYLLVQIDGDEVTLRDVRRSRVLVLLRIPSDARYDKFKRLCQYAETYTGGCTGQIPYDKFQKVWKEDLIGQRDPAKTRANVGVVIAAMLDWMAGATTPSAAVATEKQIKSYIEMYTASFNS